MSIYNTVADFYGLPINEDLVEAVDNSKVTTKMWETKNSMARRKVEAALNEVTDRKIKEQIAKTGPLVHPGMSKEALSKYIFDQLGLAGKNN